MTRLDRGPAMAIMNSALAVGGSSPISATPPKMNRVMPFMGMPNLPGHQGVAELVGHDGDEEPQRPHHPHGPVSRRGEIRIPGGKAPLARDQVTSTAMTIQLRSMLTSNPRSLNIFWTCRTSLPPHVSFMVPVTYRAGTARHNYCPDKFCSIGGTGVSSVPCSRVGCALRTI